MNGSGRRVRPLSEASGMGHRQYSRRLQRLVSDFGIDHPFNQVPGKLQEHHGISIPVESARRITEKHAQQSLSRIDQSKSYQVGKSSIVAEMDGSMVPIVEHEVAQPSEDKEENPEASVDKRKQKKLCFREYRLSLAHEAGSKTLYYGGTFGSVDEAGTALRRCVEQVGFDVSSQVHVVGDGAQWIADQVENQFGAQGSYLVDLYHVCEYLSEAADVICPNKSDERKKRVWIEEQKSALKTNQLSMVLEKLLPHIESSGIPDEQSPVRRCYRYLHNRSHQLNYQDALEKDLPLGSGEIESAHRYIVQNRMKIAGAWWKKENAEAMLALRTCRANGQWEEYWKQVG